MIQFLNNIWLAISYPNELLVYILLVPARIIENYLIMNLFLIIFKVRASTNQKLLYLFLTLLIGCISEFLVPSPFNIFLNYACSILSIRYIFKLNLLKSFIALIVSTFVFALLNILIQTPYLRLFNISADDFLLTPIYRFSYLTILYALVIMISKVLQKFINLNFTLDLLDALDKKTKRLICLNLFVGFCALCIQLITTAFYLDSIPIIISCFDFILSMFFFTISIHSFIRIVQLAATQKKLAYAEDCNKSLKILYDKVNGFKHDFDNIMFYLSGYIESNDIDGLKNYFNEIQCDYKITENLSIINPYVINNPGLYSFLNNKLFKATNLGISFEIEYFLDCNKLSINTYILSRILGILIDNAIEASEKCDSKIINLSFIRDNLNGRAIITIKNTYSNKNVDIENIFKKGISSKENHFGIGLWEVQKYVRKNQNIKLKTTKDEQYFKQELFIYDS